MRMAALSACSLFKVAASPPSLVPQWARTISRGTLTLMQVESCCAVIVSSLVLVLGVRWLWWHHKRRDSLRQPSISHAALAVFITGCDSGLGFETAVLLDRLGFTVFAGCLNPCSEGARQLRLTASSRLFVINLDVTDQLKVDFAVKAIEQQIQRLHLSGLWSLINNAGIYIVGHVDWFTWEQCQRQVEVNLLGVIRVTKACLPLIKKTKGRIINVSSFSGRVALPYRSVYSATKFGLEGFSESLRIELLKNGVHVALIRMSNHSRLTNICSGQLREAQIMWQKMDPRERQASQRSFWRVQTAAAFASRQGPASYRETTVLHDIVHALTSSHPFACYNSGTCWDVALFHVFSRLPSCLRDRLISQVL